MSYRIVQHYPTPFSFFIRLICFTHGGEIIHCSDEWRVYTPSFTGTKQKNFQNAISIPHEMNRLSKCLLAVIFLPFSFFVQFRQHYFLTVIAVYTVDREAS